MGSSRGSSSEWDSAVCSLGLKLGRRQRRRAEAGMEDKAQGQGQAWGKRLEPGNSKHRGEKIEKDKAVAWAEAMGWELESQ